jgi:putative ABC transport system permease protein
MLNLNLKMAWRNFWKNRRYTLMNIVGLSIALTLFLVALLYRNSENRYERWNPGHENVYRINLREDQGDVPLTPRPFAAAVRELPVTEAATTVSDYWRGQMLITTPDKKLYQNNIVIADSSFLDVFQYPLRFGDRATALKEPHMVVLSRSLAETLFGRDANPVGQSVTMGDYGLCKVSAVIDPGLYPGHIPFTAIIGRNIKLQNADWTSNNTYVYVRARPNTLPDAYVPQLNKTYADMAMASVLGDTDMAKGNNMEAFRDDVSTRRYYFTPVDQIHLNSTLKYEWSGNGSGKYLRSLFLVVLIILAMAAINFTNLSVAYATRRAKETGLRKVIGAARIQLVLQFLLETFFQCCMALILGLILAELCLPFINARMGLDIHGWVRQETGPLLGQLFLCVLGTTLMAGLYPSLVMSGYLPSVVLKGNFSGGTKGVRLRRILLVLQFTCASVFASGIYIIIQQISYMRHMDLGYQAGQVLAIQVHNEKTNESFTSVRDRLTAIPGVVSVSRTSQIQGQAAGGNNYPYKGKSIMSDFLSVDQDYCKTMGISLVQGREFDGTHALDTFGSVYVNEAFARVAGLHAAGEVMDFGSNKLTVVGIVKDFHAGAPSEAIAPMVFQLLHGNSENYVLVRVQTGRVGATLTQIASVWETVEPAYPIQYTFLDEHFASLFRTQEQFSFLFSIFTTMALILAVMGVVALAAYTAERKTKEITIRKVLGASVGQILTLLNRDFVVWVLVANLLAVPLSLWLINAWLRDFAYRVSPGVGPFALALVGSLGATVIVVTLQSLKASFASPVQALKYE